MQKQTYYVIGLMSGTSLDGLDIAFTKFEYNNKWNYTLLQSDTIAYSDQLKDQLRNAELLNGQDLLQLHNQYGRYLGQQCKDFISKYNIQPDFIASHGHTIFHQPNLGYTLQIGGGDYIAVHSGLTTICDFRNKDVALGGQGAPLVPIGDLLLFSDYDACINLGGIANISLDIDGKRIAFDICPFNMPLNHLMKKLGYDYDPEGSFAAKGSIDTKLLQQLNDLDYYQRLHPKSLGKEWFIDNILPLIELKDADIYTFLRTFVEHYAIQISRVLNENACKKVLFTGGGTKNTFFLEVLRKHVNDNVIFDVPNEKIIDYKEAIIFAFLGALRYRNEINCLASVTGASIDSSSGNIYYP
ncbi:MAG: anhydro-N-acetylmuramic acid kinase [Hyphomicrobiales bacterium]